MEKIARYQISRLPDLAAIAAIADAIAATL